MTEQVQKILMASAACAVGVGLVLFGLLVARQLIWMAAGIFFGVVGFSALVLTLAPATPGPLGDWLQSPAAGKVILIAVVGSLLVVAALGIIGSAVK